MEGVLPYPLLFRPSLMCREVLVHEIVHELLARDSKDSKVVGMEAARAAHCLPEKRSRVNVDEGDHTAAEEDG